MVRFEGTPEGADMKETDTPTELLTLLGHSAVAGEIKKAVTRSPGARFYRCAFQVNPFDYSVRHAVATPFQTEEEYNKEMVEACLKAGVDVVAVTDHFRIANSVSLIAAFEAAGIIVFPGFEANSSEGIHLLCLFEPGTSVTDLEQHIGACTVADRKVLSPQSTQTCEALLKLVADLGGLCIAPHVCSASGLLKTLSGQSRARAWKSDYLLAAGLPGPRDQAPDGIKSILLNEDETARRPQPICIVNANDISTPDGFTDDRVTTYVKMTAVSIEGLRQGFMDWESRVRLNSEAIEGEHTEIVAMGWAGGLFDGQSLRLNQGLNVLVGGRGAGKSTMIESLRYTFGLVPKGLEAQRSHNAIIKGVLGAGAKVSVLIRSPSPSPQYYLIERIYGQQPVVRDQAGMIIAVKAQELIGDVDIFGQHEISELTRQPEQLAEILRRFTSPVTDSS
ncbi:phosphoesterase, partial [Mesorhizobium sp. M5C.F.Ca.IN.020.14.1.1]